MAKIYRNTFVHACDIYYVQMYLYKALHSTDLSVMCEILVPPSSMENLPFAVVGIKINPTETTTHSCQDMYCEYQSLGLTLLHSQVIIYMWPQWLYLKKNKRPWSGTYVMCFISALLMPHGRFSIVNMNPAQVQHSSQRPLWLLKAHFYSCHVKGAWSSENSQLSLRWWCQQNLCAWNKT